MTEHAMIPFAGVLGSVVALLVILVGSLLGYNVDMFGLPLWAWLVFLIGCLVINAIGATSSTNHHNHEKN